MKDNVWSFHYQYRNVNPFMESFRDEKFTTRHKRHNPMPHSWLSSCGKIEIPHSRLRRSWGIFISPRLLSHSWGIGISLLWLVVNFQFLHLRLRRSCRNYPVPETFHKWIGSFPLLAAARLVKEISRPHFLKWQDWAISSKYVDVIFWIICQEIS